MSALTSIAVLTALLILVASLMGVGLLYRGRTRALHDVAATRALLQAATRDRQRTALRLHRATLQELSAARMALQSALRELPNGHPARTMLDVTSQAIGNALSDVLDAASDLYPEDISATRLRAALDRLVVPLRRDGALSGITVRFDVPPSPEVMATIYRCTRECIGAIQRGPRISTVQIEIAGDEEEIRVEIADDAHGEVSAHEPEAAQDNGLALAASIAAESGGCLQVAASPGDIRTTVIVVPVGTTR